MVRERKQARIDYPSLRAYLEAHPNGQWVMRGGHWAGRVRTSKGLLSESQMVGMADAFGSVSMTEDSLDYPVFERDGTVFIPKGTVTLSIPLPMDVPLMSEEFTV